MRCINKEFFGGVICAFGAGALLTNILPFGALFFVQGFVIVGAGLLVLCR